MAGGTLLIIALPHQRSGDLEDRYITSRYRVLVSKEQYDRTVAYKIGRAHV